MLSRTVLPLLRPRTLPPAARLVSSQYQFRSIASVRGKPGRVSPAPGAPKPQSPASKQPLRSIPKQPEHTPPSSATSAAAGVGSSQPAKASPETQQASSETASQKPLPDLRDGIPSEFDSEPPQPSQPLPDLTRGIPSTIDAELRQAQKSSKDSFNITEEPEEPQTAGTSGRPPTDGLPRSAYVSSSDRKRERLAKFFYLSFGIGGLAYLVYMGRNWDLEEQEEKEKSRIADGYTPTLMYQRAMARFGSTVSYYKDPVTPKLLPDATVLYGDPSQVPPFTLVLSLEDMLVHSEWTREHGWRVAKRPGFDYFVRYLSQYYELVLFTSQPSFAVEQMLRKMDPYQLLIPLFREHTAYEDGVHVKDLSYLNRDLSKVIIMDTDAKHVKKQPENAIILPKWTGDPKDKGLIEMIPFLEYLANMGFSDARDVLKSFEGKTIPVEFDRRQKLIREKFEAERGEKRKKRSFGGVSSIFGTKPKTVDGQQTLGEAQAEGKMIWDTIRERGQQQYMALEKRINEEGEKWLAEKEAMEKKMQEEAVASMKGGMFSWFGGSSDAKNDEKKE